MSEARRTERLRAMGIVRWRARHADAVAEPGADAAPVTDPRPDSGAQPQPAPSVGDPDPPVVPVVPVALAGAQSGEASLAALDAQVAACARCELHRSRTRTVFGVGDPAARLMVIGEAPGAEEDAQGEPFVGRAGRLLNAMLMGIGLERRDVYIANILKCRPPRNRDPAAEEVAACSDYLTRQITLVAPTLILAVGRIAAQNLLGVSTPIGKLRGRDHVHPGTDTPVLVTYHPAYLLRAPLEKRRSWEDLKQVARRLGIEP